jgi:hypothetical protein
VQCLVDPIDVVFAGMPRSGVWPADAAEPPPTAGTLFHSEPEAAAEADLERAPGRLAAEAAAVAGTPSAPDRPAKGPAPAAAASLGPAELTLGFWDEDPAIDPAAGSMPDPAAELDAGRVALVAGHHDEAALRFGIALRLAPALAPAILEATEGARSSAVTIVRGDAFRAAGDEPSARRAYALAAHGGLPDRRRRARGASPASSESAPVADGASSEPGAPPASAADRASAKDPAPAGDAAPAGDDAPA